MAPRRLLDTSVVVLVGVAALLPRTQPFVFPASVHSSTGRQGTRRAPTSVNINMRSERPSELAGVDRASFLRAALGSAAALATVVSKPRAAPAFDIPLPFTNDDPELEKVMKVADCLRFVRKLEQDLKAGALKGGPEDSAVVSRVLEVYLKPMQESMKEVAPVMELAGREARDRARLLPSIMLGHLLELEMACGTKNAKEQLQEVEEVRETLDEFIALAKTRYEIKIPQLEAPDGDQLGIFGCSFYGMK
ncbi:unnamed protein product, partial [Hapterophycus canaliculatus]